jgi:lipoprotein-anchoring transpeptidase ErfK/SrfK
MVLTTLVSTGTAETPEVATPIGQWQVLVKLLSETMEGVANGEEYRVEDVPYVLYFTNEGHAIHGTYWHNNFGTPMSHGCVNLPIDVAEWMFRWAPEGTGVTVIA